MGVFNVLVDWLLVFGVCPRSPTTDCVEDHGLWKFSWSSLELRFLSSCLRASWVVFKEATRTHCQDHRSLNFSCSLLGRGAERARLWFPICWDTMNDTKIHCFHTRRSHRRRYGTLRVRHRSTWLLTGHVEAFDIIHNTHVWNVVQKLKLFTWNIL